LKDYNYYLKKITIKEDQLVKFTDSINYLTFYQTDTQITTVILPHERTDLIEYTKKYAVKKKNKLVYEREDVIAPLQYENLNVHFEFNEPIGVMNYAYRTYEVSHWGNIAVEDKYQIENIGAKLEGEFGRIDYDEYGRHGGKNAIKKLRAHLPLKSFGLWYRDEIGNVSTSRAAREWEEVRLDLTPRFPIMGGWKSNFNIGYNLPTKFHVLTDENDNYNLNVTFGLPYNDLLARNYSVRIVLPEGSDNIKVNLPIEAKFQIIYEKSYSYLDLFGRPTVVINMKNCYDIHKVNLSVNYTYSKLTLFFKPLLVVLFFFALFVAIIGYFRTDLTLHPPKGSKIKAE